ncbi:MAG TPA: ArsR family transcriptional regulator [Phototrophicaceae bacterium]|nr:ArsR family transcriptional regulator [Phototrophicaceae bacterium]
MQETRQYILDILKERGEATVDDIVDALRKRRGAITAVTVRHHLARLQEESLITNPQLRHRNAPGRPQHVYTLTEAAKEYFPNNYKPLAAHLFEQLTAQLPPRQVNVILEGVANRMAAEANIGDIPLPERLNLVIDYMNNHGYSARWEKQADGFMLEITNCPYHHISINNPALCEMDMRMISALLGAVPRLQTRMSRGDSMCSYLVPIPTD